METNDIFTAIALVVIGLLIEYLVIKPVANFLEKNKKNINAGKFFEEISPVLAKIVREFTKTFGWILFLFLFIVIFFYDFFLPYLKLNIEIIQGEPPISVSTNTLIVVYTFLTIQFSRFLPAVYRKILTVIAIACAAALIIVTGYEYPFEQMILKIIAITFSAFYGSVVILDNQYQEQYENLKGKIDFLNSLPEITKLAAQESQKLTRRIQLEWENFINNPADDYINYITTCVPVRCDGYLLTIGYITASEGSTLINVKNALEEDLQYHFKMSNLQVQFEKINREEHRKISNLLNKLNNDKNAETTR